MATCYIVEVRNMMLNLWAPVSDDIADPLTDDRWDSAERLTKEQAQARCELLSKTHPQLEFKVTTFKATNPPKSDG